jgi:hypothetical protein
LFATLHEFLAVRRQGMLRAYIGHTLLPHPMKMKMYQKIPVHLYIPRVSWVWPRVRFKNTAEYTIVWRVWNRR